MHDNRYCPCLLPYLGIFVVFVGLQLVAPYLKEIQAGQSSLYGVVGGYPRSNLLTYSPEKQIAAISSSDSAMYLWSALMFFAVTACVVTLGVSLTAFWQFIQQSPACPNCGRWRSWVFVIMPMVFLAILGAVFFLVFGRASPDTRLEDVLIDQIDHHYGMDNYNLHNLRWLTDWITNPLAILAVVAIFLAASAALLPPSTFVWKARELADRIYWHRVLLFLTAATLIAGVLEARSFDIWPIAWLPPGETAEGIYAFASSMSTALGIFLSSLLFVVFVPGQLWLRLLAKKLARVRPPDQSEEDWLKLNGLSSSMTSDLAGLCAVLGPLLAGETLPAILHGLSGRG